MSTMLSTHSLYSLTTVFFPSIIPKTKILICWLSLVLNIQSEMFTYNHALSHGHLWHVISARTCLSPRKHINNAIWSQWANWTNSHTMSSVTASSSAATSVQALTMTLMCCMHPATVKPTQFGQNDIKQRSQNATQSHIVSCHIQNIYNAWFLQHKPCVGPGHPSSPLSIYFLILSPFTFLSFIGFTYFLLLSIPSLSTRIVPLRFQAGGDRTWF